MSRTLSLSLSLFSLAGLAACSEHGQTPDPFGVPISGGTMIISNDGQRAIVADPDRDRILTMDLASGSTINELALDPGDEPGRLVEDGAGRVHVALRRGGALVTLDQNGQLVSRRYACSEPRGVAYDGATDDVHVACAGGELVTFAAAGGDAPIRTLRLERDLRDVIVQGANLVVTKFRTAEILTVDPSGTIVSRVLPPTVQRSDFGLLGDGTAPPDSGSGTDPLPPSDGTGVIDAAASTAWRTIAMPDGRIVMTHQRKTRQTLDSETPGGYGGGCGEGPVEAGVTMMAPGAAPVAVHQIGNGALPVDIAASPAGDKIAMVVAGNRQVVVVGAAALDQPDTDDCQPPPPPPCEDEDGENCDCGQPTPGGPVDPNTDTPVPDGMGGGGLGVAGCGCQDQDFDGNCDDDPGDGNNERLGTPTSVAWMPNGDLAVFYPEAPAILIHAGGGVQATRRIDLPGKAAFDAGRSLFHTQTAIGLACASCHPEGRDDGQTWDFAAFGPRRTQSLAGHILERAPYHWTGEENSLPALMDDVFSSRMAGGFLTDRQKASLGPWLDRIPAPAPAIVDAAAAERGKAVFESAGCATCHNGDVMTNNALVNVNTGGNFKVPSLLGVGARPPYMHDGCAATLMDRFVTCGGGDAHGITSSLSQTELTDLVTYLDSL